MTSHVADECASYKEDKEAWGMVQDLWGGTKTMRAARTTWLPQEEEESDKGYDNRLKRSFLLNMYRSAVENVAGKPFSKPVTLQNSENLPEPLDQIEEDVDRTGRGLTQFGKEILTYAVHYGVHFVLVDFPTRDPKQPATLASDRANKIRPMFVHVKAPDLRWIEVIWINGVPKLNRIRIHEQVEIETGEGGTEVVDQIREISRTEWKLHQKAEDAEDFSEVSNGKNTFGEVPLLAFYTNRTGFMRGQPAFEDLAWLNICHWQSNSDQRSILRFARVGILFLKGLNAEEKKEKIQIGANRVLKTSSEKADGKFIEHSGHSIQAGERDLEKLENQMRHMSLQPYVKQSGNVTATAKAIDTSEADSMIQSWVRLLEDFIKELYRVAGLWVKKELPDEFDVSIQKDFALSLRGDEDIKELREMVLNDLISHETYLREIKRRSVLHESLDIEVELRTIEDQKPREDETPPPKEDVPDDSDQLVEPERGEPALNR